MSFKDNLQRLMQERKMTVSRLSRDTGVPAKTLYHWLSGQQPSKLEHLFKVADFFNVSVEEMFGRPRKNFYKELSAASLEKELRAGVYEVILRPAGILPSRKS